MGSENVRALALGTLSEIKPVGVILWISVQSVVLLHYLLPIDSSTVFFCRRK